MVKVKRNLTGQIFGKWKVLNQTDDYIDNQGKHYARWLCECQCDKHTIRKVIGKDLKCNKSLSCGCVQIIAAKFNGKANKKYNTYDLSGEYGIGYTSKGKEFYFDLEDYDKIKDYCWYYNDSGYVMAYDTNTNEHIRLHQLVMKSLHTEYDVDHKVHPPKPEHKIDNRKSNLRLVTRTENRMNTALRSDNTSGVTGVCWNKALDKWLSRITVNGHVISLGHYNDFESAVRARKEAEEKYFGDYRYDQYN